MLTKNQKSKALIAIQGVLIGVVLKSLLVATNPTIIGIGIVILIYLSAETVKRIMKNDTHRYS